MTQLLQKAIDEVSALSSLPKAEQDQIAEFLLEFLHFAQPSTKEEEAEWDGLMNDPRSKPFFEKMAAQVDADIAEGRVSDLDPSHLIK